MHTSLLKSSWDSLLPPRRAASSHLSRGERDRVSGLAGRPHLSRRQHCRFQPHLAERRPRRPPGSTGERPGQPVPATVVSEPGSVWLVRVRRHERRRRDLRADLPHCARWAKSSHTRISSNSPIMECKNQVIKKLNMLLFIIYCFSI